MKKRQEFVTQNLVLNSSSSIEEALVAITDNQRGAVIVVDDDFILRGVASDGDLRRGMLHGATAIAPVSKIMNTNARAIRDRSEGEEVFKENAAITLLPVVDKENRVIDVLVRDKHVRKAIF